jgi:Leucine-rich repeat (LRR) protein
MYELATGADGQPFYTMKFVQGTTLKDVLNRLKTGDPDAAAKHSLNQLLTVFQKVCDAVAFAHSKGVIHRDLKPENIMLGEFGEVLVMDWGLAKVLEAQTEGGGLKTERGVGVSPAQAGSETGAPAGFQELDSLPGNTERTLEGQIMGTPQFMAPEQAEGRIADIDGRTDIFALGGILYSLLSLRPPTGGSTVREILANIQSGYIPPATIYNKARKRAADGTELEDPIALAHCPGNLIPDSLSAVAMKAMAVSAGARYQTVAELQKDIAAYQGGFATSAEAAGMARQFWLLFLRHKTVATLGISATLIILSLVTGFTWKVMSVRNALRGTAPAFYKDAKMLVEEQQFTNALISIDQAIYLQPSQADFHSLKGNILQSMLRLEQARAAYDEALKRKHDHAQAQKNRALCEDLLRASGGKNELSFESMEKLRTELLAQGRSTEAIAIGQRLGRSTQDELARWKGILDQQPGWRFNLSRAQDNRLVLRVGNAAAVTNLAPLKGMPLAQLYLEGSPLTDLNPLRGMALSHLGLHNCTNLSDLEPLAGMPLRWLYLDGCIRIRQLEPLRGMPLGELDLRVGENEIDLRPLRGMPIRLLRLTATKVKDLGPLKGMPLGVLEMSHCTEVTDLGALEGMPLVQFGAYNCPRVSNFAFLKGMKLTSLDVSVTQFADLSVVKGMPLTRLEMGGTKVSDLGPLEGMPLTVILMESTKATSLAPLKDCPLTELNISATLIKDLGPLLGKQITQLNLHDTAISDLRPLAGMPLERLWFGNSQVTNLAPLAGLKILNLDVRRTKVKDLAALQGMPLERMVLDDTPVTDLSPLANSPLKELYLWNTPVTNLTALRGLPLRELRLDGCKNLKDLDVLAECKQLVRIALPNQIRDLDALRSLTNLQFIGYLPMNDYSQVPPAADFWRAYDLRNAAKKK